MVMYYNINSCHSVRENVTVIVIVITQTHMHTSVSIHITNYYLDSIVNFVPLRLNQSNQCQLGNLLMFPRPSHNHDTQQFNSTIQHWEDVQIYKYNRVAESNKKEKIYCKGNFHR